MFTTGFSLQLLCEVTSSGLPQAVWLVQKQISSTGGVIFCIALKYHSGT